MDSVMAFLMKYVGGFFTWWKNVTKLPTVVYTFKSGKRVSVNWSLVVFVLLLWVAMWLFLP